MIFIISMIDYRGDPTGRFPFMLSHEQGDIGILVEGINVRINQILLVHIEGGNPVWIFAVMLIGKI